jgi:hypothetical protein
MSGLDRVGATLQTAYKTCITAVESLVITFRRWWSKQRNDSSGKFDTGIQTIFDAYLNA